MSNHKRDSAVDDARRSNLAERAAERAAECIALPGIHISPIESPVRPPPNRFRFIQVDND